MILAEFLPATPNRLWDYAAQIGVRHDDLIGILQTLEVLYE